MNKVTLKRVKQAGQELEKITREAKRRLFEFETLSSVYEIMEGKAKTFSSAKKLFSSLS